MPRRAILHIGLPRTGTTTLQRIWSGLRPQLAQRGILYPALTPASAAAPHLSHQHLGEALDGRRPAAEREALLSHLVRELRRDDVDTVLLSYESLALAPRRRAVPQRLAGLIAAQGYTIEILVTLKPQAELINSMYTWRIQFLRESRSFGHYVRAAIAAPRLRYDEVVRPWRAYSGRVHAVAVRDPRTPAPLISRVLDAIGLAERVDPLIGPDDQALIDNRSPGPIAVEAARRLARSCPAGAAAARDVMRFIEHRARSLGGDEAAFQGVEPALRDRIAKTFAAHNERFALQTWGTPWDACVADEPARPVNEIAGRTVPPDIEALIRDIIDAATTAHGLRPARPVTRLLHRLAAVLAPS